MSRSALLLLLGVVACAPPPDLDAARATIATTDSLWLAAAQAGNVDSAVSFWAEDARVIAPGQPPYVGREAIRQMLLNGLATPGFSASWETTEIVVVPPGDIAYSFGTNAFTVATPEGGLDTLRGQGVVVWRLGDDGRWRSVIDIWNLQPQ